MEDLKFPEWVDPRRNPYGKPEGALSIVQDPEYDIPGAVIIGLSRYGDYHNIVLDDATALRFAAALQKRCSRPSAE